MTILLIAPIDWPKATSKAGGWKAFSERLCATFAIQQLRRARTGSSKLAVGYLSAVADIKTVACMRADNSTWCSCLPEDAEWTTVKMKAEEKFSSVKFAELQKSLDKLREVRGWVRKASQTTHLENFCLSNQFLERRTMGSQLRSSALLPEAPGDRASRTCTQLLWHQGRRCICGYWDDGAWFGKQHLGLWQAHGPFVCEKLKTEAKKLRKAVKAVMAKVQAAMAGVKLTTKKLVHANLLTSCVACSRLHARCVSIALPNLLTCKYRKDADSCMDHLHGYVWDINCTCLQHRLC